MTTCYWKYKAPFVKVGIYTTKDLDEIAGLLGIDKDEAAISGHTGVFAIEIPSKRGLEVRKPMFPEEGTEGNAVGPEAERLKVPQPQNTVLIFQILSKSGFSKPLG